MGEERDQAGSVVQVALDMGRASLLTEVSVPSELRGWMLVGRGGSGAPRPVLRILLEELHGLGVGTLVLPLPARNLDAMARRIAVATAHLKDDLAGGLPVAYLGAGPRAAGGWVASLGGDLDAVVAWNGRSRRAWRHLPYVGVPSLLVVDGNSGHWRATVDHATCRRLGGPAELARRSHVADAAPLLDWYERHLLDGIAFSTDPPRRRLVTVRRAASIATVTALTSFSAGLAQPATALPDFSAGVHLSAARVSGVDGIGDVEPAGTYKPGDKHHERGVMGDPPLTDGLGLRWNVNTNIGFITTSSASGAVSEANFTHAVAASTLNGGTVNQVLADTFDGYNALCVDVNNVGGQCNTANMSVYNQNGPASLECSGRQVVLPLRTIGNLQVRRKVFVPSNDGFARWLNIFRNTSASPQVVRMVTSNNLGSDANTRIVTTSDGDAVAELSDTWVTTFQNYSGTTSSDPRLGHVLRGLRAPVGLAVNNFTDGDDNPFWRYQFTLPPGATAIIMNFATGQASKAAAASASAALASLTNPNALACMTPTELAQVRNFLAVPSLPGVVTTSTNWSLRDTLTSGPPSLGPFAYGTRPLVPIIGDWDGDGIKTPGTFEAGTFKLRNSNSAGAADMTFNFGNARGFPVAGDFDGDLKDDVAVFRNGTWEVRLMSGAPVASFTFGSGAWPATIPVAGDWDGDGIDGIGTYSAGAWNLRQSASSGASDISFTYNPGTMPYPVVGDWDRNGTDTPGVKAGDGTAWQLRNSNSAGSPDLTINFGAANDFPVVWGS